MNQRQLKYFLTVYESGSFKEAAEKLMITPQGLSKTILALEEEVGNKLFSRTKKGVVPTTYARKLKPDAVNVIHAYEKLEHNISEKPKEKEVLTIYTTYGFLCKLTSEFIERFYEENPNVLLNIIETTDSPAVEKLLQNEIELAILPAPLDTTLFHGERLFTNKHCMIVNKNNPLSNYEKINYRDLENQPLALKGQEYLMYNNNINRFLSSGITPTIYIETSSDELICRLAQEGVAIGVTLDYLAKEMPHINTKIIPFADDNCNRTVYIAQPKNSVLSKSALSFKNSLLQFFCNLDK